MNETALTLMALVEGDDLGRLGGMARIGIEHDMTDDEIKQAIRTVLADHPMRLIPVSDYDITSQIRSQEFYARRGSALILSNYLAVRNRHGKPTREPLSMACILENLKEMTGGWPRRIGNVPFVDGPHGFHSFAQHGATGLFGWLKSKMPVTWAKGGNYVSQGEVYAEICRTAQQYDGIELLPHEPPIEGVYYRGVAPPPGDGSHLRWLLNRFRPETTIDRDLILAAFLTVFAGLPPGRRPAFVITSDDGRGAGKTTLVEIIGYLAGGIIDVNPDDDHATVKTRLLSSEGQTKRVCQIDNVKATRFSSAELESQLTTPVISGKQLYCGEGRRPNLLTWFLTLNGVSMATDMAQRSVVIKLLKGENSGSWYEETIRYIDDHRTAIIGDIIAALRVESKPLANHSRWATWEQHVLCRLPDPEGAQRLILERQGAADVEQDDAEIIESQFAQQLAELGHDPSAAVVRIPVAKAAEWYAAAMGERVKTTAASRRLNQMAREGQLRRIAADPSRSHGRCFVWTGEHAGLTYPICNALVAA